MTEKYTVTKYGMIYDNHSSVMLNIDFEDKTDAELCCKLLNSQHNSIMEYILELDKIAECYKKEFGRTIYDEDWLKIKDNKDKRFHIKDGEVNISKRDGIFRVYDVEDTHTDETYTFDSNMGERNLRALIRLLNDVVV